MQYRTKTVVELTGIPRNTLVAWERRHGVPAPRRGQNGYRTYTDADVRTLLRLRDSVGSGFAISEAVETVRATGRRTKKAGFAYERAADDLFDAVVAVDPTAAARALESVEGAPFVSIIGEVFFVVLRRVGDAWEEGRASVVAEHFASAFIRDELASMLKRAASPAPRGTRVVCIGYPGDKHELGLLGLAVHLALQSCRVTYLGPDVPIDEACRFLRSMPQDVACVSVMMKTRASELSAYATALAASARRTRVVIGGAGLPVGDDVVGPRRVSWVRDWRDLDLAAGARNIK